MKNRVLTLFFVFLTLSIGLTSINLQTSPFNQAVALENKINDVIKKVCPSYEKSNVIKEKVANFVSICLSNLKNHILTIDRNILLVQASKDGESAELDSSFIIVKDETDGTSEKFRMIDDHELKTFTIPIGHTYSIEAGAKHSNLVKALFTGSCQVVAPLKCSGVMDSGGKTVTVYLNRIV